MECIENREPNGDYKSFEGPQLNPFNEHCLVPLGPAGRSYLYQWQIRYLDRRGAHLAKGWVYIIVTDYC